MEKLQTFQDMAMQLTSRARLREATNINYEGAAGGRIFLEHNY